MDSLKQHLRLLMACAFFALVAGRAYGQAAAEADSDGDGLSDALENTLLQAFRPTLMVSADDCSNLPAEFTPGLSIPTVLHEDGTLYGQAFPRPTAAGEPQQIELHFYHLWRKDCGRMGHPLDAEHVSVLLQATAGGWPNGADGWIALYWYAAAHEDTVCDASQMARASTLSAVTHGATVWSSSGKHATFLSEQVCHYGCGGDTCTNSKPAPAAAVINLGEAVHPMNGAAWIGFARWPLRDKVMRSDFSAERLARLNSLPGAVIALAKPTRHPVLATLHGGNATIDGVLRGSDATNSALVNSHRTTDVAVIEACDWATRAMGRACRATGHALKRSMHCMGRIVLR